MHYDDPMADIPPARRRALRSEWIADHAGHPVLKLLRKTAHLDVHMPGPTIVVPRGRKREQVGGPVTIAGPKFRDAHGVFDHSGQVFCFVEDDGVYWDIDTDVAMNIERLKKILRFDP